MQLRPFLVITQGPDKGQVIPMEAESVRVGRDPNCQVVLSDGQVSRKHIKIYRSKSRWAIVDLNSSNGTLVNGEQITLHELEDGDLIIIGETMIGFHLTADPVQLEAGGSAHVATQTITVNERDLYTFWRKQGDADGVRRARTDLEALYRAGRTINSILSTAELLRTLIEVVFEEIAKADRCSVHVAAEGSEEFVQQVGMIRGAGEPTEEAILSQTMAAQVREETNALLTYDAMLDQRFAAGDSVHEQGIRSAICAPLTAGGKLVGMLYADSTDPGNRFTVDDLRFMAAIALQAGTAVENARLYERLAEEKAALEAAHTALQSAQEQLIQSEKLAAVGRLSSGIVHDMKNPMTVILGYAGLIRDRATGGVDVPEVREGIRRLVDEIEVGVSHVNQVIEQLLMFARPSDPVKVPTDVRELVQDTVRFLAHETNAAGIKVREEMPADLPPTAGDPNQIKQVFMNVVLNGVQAMEPRWGLLTIRGEFVTRDGVPCVETTFEDNGCGMSEAQQAKIFDPFYTTKEAGEGLGGTGLGLSVAYRIIENHGGTIRVRSEPGKGSAFTVALPVAE